MVAARAGSHDGKPLHLRGEPLGGAAASAAVADLAVLDRPLHAAVRRRTPGHDAAPMPAVVGLPAVSAAAQSPATPADHPWARPSVGALDGGRHAPCAAAVDAHGAAPRHLRRDGGPSRARVADVLQAHARVARRVSLRRRVGSDARPRWTRTSAPARRMDRPAVRAVRQAPRIVAASDRRRRRANQPRSEQRDRHQVRELPRKVPVERCRTIRFQ